MTIVGTVAKGSAIHKQLEDYYRQPPNFVVPYFSSSSLAGKENMNPVSNGQALNSNSSLNREISAPPSTVQCESEMAPLSTPANDYDELQLQQISDCNVNNQQQEQNISILKVQLMHLNKGLIFGIENQPVALICTKNISCHCETSRK
ncbi:unnamed protein product [Porites evermanni]|uniref:Uncharacterized protein n=1 Tax=Porites evermanni TaxID=104178 RepID=A0ABN8RGZ5_9CNID|nr:unnamed protein product [Porites evermanni]